MHAVEYRIIRISNAYEPILILLRSILSLLVLLQLVERDNARAKTQSHELVPTANCQDGYSSRANELTKTFKNRLLVVIKVTERSTQDNSVRLKFGGR